MNDKNIGVIVRFWRATNKLLGLIADTNQTQLNTQGPGSAVLPPVALGANCIETPQVEPIDDGILRYNATCMTIEEGLKDSCMFAASKGVRVEAIAVSTNSFLFLCLALGKLFTLEPNREIWLKAKLPDGSVDSIQVYADPSVPETFAHCLADLVLDPKVVVKVELSS